MAHVRKYKESDGFRRAAGLVPAFALALAVAVALPVSTDSGFAVNGAFAAGNGNGNAGGNGVGKALGRATAPGQQQDQAADADEQGATSGGVASGLDTDTGSTEVAGEDASILVIQELAGLPDGSALTDEEELDAIRSGWGTWRTADGPNSVTAQ